MNLVTIQEMSLFDIMVVWIHLTAATFWVGGMLFLSLVAVPLLKKDPDPLSAQRGFINLARRFRTLVWIALALLVITGSLLLPNQVDLSVSLGKWPPVVLIKITLVLLLLGMSLAHDQLIGPKVRTLKHKPTPELSAKEKLLIRLSPVISRLTLVLGLAILLAAVFMVRS
ncbi:MAG: CopD family protein [Nitrospirota bacterium]|nr:MAG: CopD family protein [Nitrospirota bacterium]